MKRNLVMPPKSILVLLLVMIMIMPNCETALADDAVTLDIPVYKVIMGDMPTGNETFVFRIMALGNAPMPAGSVNGVKVVTISGDGSTAFGEITYTDLGDYCYTISEVAGSNGAYTYDETVYSLTVQVTWKNEVGGEMQAVMYLVEQGDIKKQERAVFSNTYASSTVIIDPPVQKVISGDTPSTKSTFTFYLKADNIHYPMPVGSVNGVKGLNVTGAEIKDFGNITYTEPGVYTYTVYEKDGGISGYTYDTTVYTMRVTVTEANGILSAVREIRDEKGIFASDLVFTNKYSIPEGPKTGDTSMNYIWWTLLGLAVVGISVALYCRAKRER